MPILFSHLLLIIVEPEGDRVDQIARPHADGPERAAVFVVVDEPQSQGVAYGGSFAAPAFRNIAQACIAYLGIRPARSDTALVNLQPSIYDRSSRISN